MDELERKLRITRPEISNHPLVREDLLQGTTIVDRAFTVAHGSRERILRGSPHPLGQSLDLGISGRPALKAGRLLRSRSKNSKAFFHKCFQLLKKFRTHGLYLRKDKN